jgi:hypothetical protein
MPRGPKLTLPTVDTCKWRSTPSLDGSAECDLILKMTGINAGDFAQVSMDTCTACCRSFPPSPRQPNPVIASLLFNASTRILAQTNLADEKKVEIEKVRRLAVESLDLIHTKDYRLTPARTGAPCYWLGGRDNSGRIDHECTKANTTSSSCDEENKAYFSCNHPSHELTTLAHCRTCRDWAIRAPISRSLSLDEMIPPPTIRSGPVVKRWAFGVTTASRRQSTLEDCLDSIVRSGWNDPRLFLDGSCRIPERYNDLAVTWRENFIGVWPAWFLALAELILQQPDADAYVLLQDDVVLYDRESLRDYLERILWPGDQPSIISLFSTDPEPNPGWHRMDKAWHWGAQGFIFAPEIARAIFADPILSFTCFAASSEEHVPIPKTLCEWIQRSNIDVWYANPSLSQHIGNTSTIWTDASMTSGRRAPWYSGSIESTFSLDESLSDFPEHLFPCDQATSDTYLNQIQRGRELMSKSTVVFCGLCRDVRLFLPRTAAQIEKLGSMFREYRIVLYENDSVDATRDFLADWQSLNPRLDVIVETHVAKKHLRTRSLDRAAWMAFCRNRYRERVVSKYGDFDYVVVVDTDLPGGWSFDGVAHTFGHDNWDLVGSYGIKRRPVHQQNEFPFLHFDVWAFHPAVGTKARKLVNHNELILHRGEPMLPVESSFGGLGIYRTECMRAAEYGGSDCEHVVFHNRLRKAGFDRQFLNPSQIVLYSPFL